MAVHLKGLSHGTTSDVFASTQLQLYAVEQFVPSRGFAAAAELDQAVGSAGADREDRDRTADGAARAARGVRHEGRAPGA